MRAESLRLGEPSSTVISDQVIATLLPNHKWIKPWIIRVSAGLTQIVADFLLEIEEILGVIPDIGFLHITEENIGRYDDFLAIYQRRLCIFVDAKQSFAARDRAVLYVVQRAIERSERVCGLCGGELEIKDLADDNDCLLFPFLTQVSQKKMSGYRSKVSVCVPCATRDWTERKALNMTNASDVGVIVDFEAENIDDFSDVDDNDNDDDDDDDDESDEKNTDADEADADADDEVACTKQKITMFNIVEVDSLSESYADASRDQASRVKAVVKKLRATKPDKELVVIPEHWRDYCVNLENKFPNFSDVVFFIRNQLSLSALSDNVLRLPPFLLLGPAGVGKTEFALTIAQDFKTTLNVIDICSSQTGCSLTGSESHWSNSQPGMLFNTLTQGNIANPIIMLDEIDKSSTSKSSGYDPLAALYSLLEPRQAKQFHDLSVPELTIDASHVLWIATANSIASINAPIVDRFFVFNIANPTRDQGKIIASNQYRQFIEKHPSGSVFESEIRTIVLDELGKYHPRKARKILEQAFGLAAFDCRNYLTVADIKAGDLDEKKTGGIGFLTEML
jgi:hypothetical protein